ncbi:hypothetical protein PENSPDRAFT_664658 [Peniophora sp. CONT]|nr:hypothetical protein PENSPDRAFT_664658 [Peniophora sp. CONT]
MSARSITQRPATTTSHQIPFLSARHVGRDPRMNNDADAVVEAPDTTQTAPSPYEDSGAQREDGTRVPDAVNDRTTGTASDHPAVEHDRESAAELNRRKDLEAFAELCARKIMEKLEADVGYRKAVAESMDGVRESMNGVRESMNDVRDSMDGVRKTMGDVRESICKATDGVRKSMDGVRESMNGVREAMNGVRESMNDVRESMEGVRESMDGVRESTERLMRGAKEREREAEERQRQAAERAREFERLMEKLSIARLEQERTIKGVWAAYEAQNTSPPVLYDFATVLWPVLRPPTYAPPQTPGGPPVVAGLTRSALREFLLSPAHSTGVSARARIKAALLRWHPDKMGNVVRLVVKWDRAAVEEGVKIVAGELAVLLREAS